MAYKIVDADQLDADLTTVADAIREKTGGEKKLRFPEGMAEEVDAVFEAGKTAEYDAFWDAYQENGKRTTYSYAFAAAGWNDATCKPKYTIAGTNYQNMFWESTVSRIPIGVDFSNAKNVSYVFAATRKVTKLPTIDLSNVTGENAAAICNYCENLETLSVIGIREGLIPARWFTYDAKLKNLTIEGTIGQNEFDICWSTLLSKASILSILNALSTTTSGLTVALSLTAVNNAFETSPGAADGSTSEEWTTLIATKSNWTIALMDKYKE